MTDSIMIVELVLVWATSSVWINWHLNIYSDSDILRLMILKWFKQSSSERDNSADFVHKNSVERAAVSVMSKYDKTFIDLARYDRGEKIFDKVSH